MRVTVWNENVHEKTEPESVLAVHPRGLHETVADIIREIPGAQVTVATLDMPEAGLPDEVIDNTDVLVWWGHCAHSLVPDEIVEKLHKRVLMGMGLIALHSAHYSKIFTKLMGTSCSLRWVDGVYERLFCVNPSHPIAEGIPLHFELGIDECYSEYFDIPQPDELIFTGWFDNGAMFRSGCVWTRGYGKVFYFQPGHETNRSFYTPYVRRIIQNACVWAAPRTMRESISSPQISVNLEETRRSGEQPAK